MRIHFKCHKCGTGVKAPQEFAGRDAKCPRCKQHLIVPSATQKQLPHWNTDDSQVQTAGSGSAQPSLKATPKSQTRRLGETALRIRMLRRQHEKLGHERRVHLRNALLFGVPGLVLSVLVWWGLSAPTCLLFGVIGPVLAIIGCVSYAKYKGRSPGWGFAAALTVWPLMIFLHDANRDRMNVIRAQLEAFGEY